jgi:hypothetical protein
VFGTRRKGVEFGRAEYLKLLSTIREITKIIVHLRDRNIIRKLQINVESQRTHIVLKILSNTAVPSVL